MAKKPAPKKKAASPKPVKKSKPAAPKAKPSKAPASKPAAPKPVAVKPAPAKAPPPKPVVKAPEPKKEAAPVAVRPAGSVNPLTVSAQGAGGNAAAGNTHPANILVVVSASGVPVTDMVQNNFTVMEHFAVPGQQYPFSNNIIGFKNAGSGAYLIQVKPINSAPWSSGHHLAQIIVSTAKAQGQTAVKIIVR